MSKAKRDSAHHLLTQTLNFTLDDLQANREGYLSHPQRNRLRQQRLNETFIFLSIVGFLLLLILPVIAEPDLMRAVSAPIIIFVAMGWLAGVLLFAALAYSRYQQFSADLYKGHIEAAEGRLCKQRYRIFGTAQEPSFQLRLDHQEFVVTFDSASAFQHDHFYCIYFVPHTRTILAAEPLED